MDELNHLLSTLEALVGEKVNPARVTAPAAANATVSPPRSDAITQTLADSPRQTAVVSLRDAPEVIAFREALVDGLIRADAVNQLLRLVNGVISRLLA